MTVVKNLGGHKDIPAQHFIGHHLSFRCEFSSTGVEGDGDLQMQSVWFKVVFYLQYRMVMVLVLLLGY